MQYMSVAPEATLLQAAAQLPLHPSIPQLRRYDTAGSAKLIAERKDTDVAAIASEHAAGTYGLEVSCGEHGRAGGWAGGQERRLTS